MTNDTFKRYCQIVGTTRPIFKIRKRLHERHYVQNNNKNKISTTKRWDYIILLKSHWYRNTSIQYECDLNIQHFEY
jgi:hypothetical protein